MASSTAPETDYRAVCSSTRSPLTKMPPTPSDTRLLWSAPGRWGSRPRSIWPSRVPVLLLDDDDRLSTGSRAICFVSARWRFSTASAAVSAWSTRA